MTMSSTTTRKTRPKDATRIRIERMEAEREERRRAMQERKQERQNEEQRNKAAGNPGDVDFIGLVRKWRQAHEHADLSHEDLSQGSPPRICICVRKRPVSDKERQRNDHDSITCLHPDTVWVHSAKLRVDGISKYLDHTSFCFDYSFDETVNTGQVYQHSTQPLIEFVCAGDGGRATVFAYGQTGSGKTYTMQGIQQLVAQDLFGKLETTNTTTTTSSCSLDNTTVYVAFFEIYGGYIQDLLNKRKKLKILEDGKGEIVVNGLEEYEAFDPTQFHKIAEDGNRLRTTHSTEANDTSSRSHAICQILLRDKNSGKLRGKLSLVDLAGSERGTDTKSHNTQRRTESAEINTSLLALKECIRALDMKKSGTKHVPYRASKLTLILKDCFTSKKAKTTMIATVSPGAFSVDHSLNTLRYADRIKEKKASSSKVARAKRIQAAPEQPKKKDPPKPAPQVVETPKVVSYNEIKSIDSEDIDDVLGIDTINDGNGAGGNIGGGGAENNNNVDEETYHEALSGLPASLEALDVEGELRQLVQHLFLQEESLLNLHMSNIQENAELLTEEGKMLQAVTGDNVSQKDVREYADRLEGIIERKCQLIETLQDKMLDFRKNLRREEALSQKVGKLSQY